MAWPNSKISGKKMKSGLTQMNGRDYVKRALWIGVIAISGYVAYSLLLGNRLVYSVTVENNSLEDAENISVTFDGGEWTQHFGGTGKGGIHSSYVPSQQLKVPQTIDVSWVAGDDAFHRKVGTESALGEWPRAVGELIVCLERDHAVKLRWAPKRE